ncbi:MAG TPA: hypothetical protein VHV77_05210 [Pirellulales bacterium]|jgi:hypothetical protein|nr:hypothetical protein [Pirellulales bacterium]
MTSRRRLASYLVASALLTIAALVAAGFWAWRHEPDFYREALAVDPEEQREASDQMLSHASAVVSAAHHQGEWSASFSADEINGWLAVDLSENYPDLLPREVVEPRISLTPGTATIACRFVEGSMSTVVSLEVEAYMAEPGVLALRLCKMRAGAIPIPLAKVLEGLSDVAANIQLPLQWTKAKGQPVALVTLPALGKERSRYELDSLELRDGTIYVAGKTIADGSTPRVVGPATAGRHPSSNVNVQR